jgi:succinoglycan biosynthesis transport protein ExoP
MSGMTVGVEAIELSLRDYARIIWRRKLIVVALVVVAVAAAVAIDARKTPIYQGTAGMLLTPSTSTALSSNSNNSNPANLVDAPTAVKVVESQSTRQAAAQLLKLTSVPPASASQSGTTNVVDISVKSTDPVFAAQVANAYANAYIQSQQVQALNSLLSAESQINARISALTIQINALQTRFNTITNSEISATPSVSQSAQLASVTSQQTALVTQAATFKQQLAQLQLDANLTTGGGQLVTPATTDLHPVSPHKVRDAILALLVGLLLGFGLGILRDFQDDRIRSEEDLRRSVGGLPALGLIPEIGTWRDRGTPALVSIDAPNSNAAEAYRTLRTSLQFMALDHPIRTLAITSPLSNEGKTTTAANLAVTMAKGGRRVIVVGLDLRKARLHHFFGLDSDIGFTSVLVGEASLSDALQRVPNQDGLWLLAAGPLPPNPAELLASPAAAELLELLTEEADIVIIDTPPVLPVTDAAVVAARVDAVLLVAAAGRTNRRDAGRAVELLARVDAPLVGVVVNGISQGESAGYYYGGYYGGYGYATDVESKGPAHHVDIARYERALAARSSFGQNGGYAPAHKDVPETDRD